MHDPAKKYITPEEYLAMEEKAKHRSEYYQGEIFALAGGSANHNRIVRNLSRNLDQAFTKEKCEAFITEMKVWIEARQLFTYPDVAVVCGEIEFYENRDDAIINPLIIVEVLSDSTKSYDRIEKFQYYRTLPGFQEYILVDQYKIHVEHYYKESKGKWIFTEYYQIDDILHFKKIDFEISLKDIYRRIKFKK